MFNYGDLVIHPTKKWPWLGSLRPTGVARVCSKCDEIVRVDENSLNEKEQVFTCGKCGENSKLDSSLPLLVTDVNLNTVKSIEYEQLTGSGNVVALKVSVAPNCSVGTQTTEKNCMICWHPSLSTSEMDGTEKIISPFVNRYSFQENNTVFKKDSKTFGLVKQVKRIVDAFILPDFDYVLQKVSFDRLLPIMPLDETYHQYVIYKGWVGNAYHVLNRVHFRLKDGPEFYIDEDESLKLEAHIKETSKNLTYYAYKIFPGQNVKIPWHLLEKAIWTIVYRSLEDNIKSKIEKSKHLSKLKENVDNCMNVAIETSDINLQNGKFSLEVANDLIEKVLKSLPKECLMTTHLPKIQHSYESTLETSEEEYAEATITKIEISKLNVDWIARVVSDTNLCEENIKMNILQGDDLQNILIFPDSSIKDVFEFGNSYKCKLDPSVDRIVPAEQWRNGFFAEKEPKNVDFDEIDQNLSSIFASNDYVYLTEAFNLSKVDVLWEDGNLEHDVDLCDLTPHCSYPADRDFFPAMYVYMQETAGHSSDVDSEDDKRHGTESSPLVADKHKSFGIVRRANNREKYAFVDWYSFDSQAFANAPLSEESSFEPKYLKSEEVSFYELKFYHDYNYVPGSLIMRQKPEKPDLPNVGCVRRKNVDGSVSVVWHDGREETTDPWRLKQLSMRTRYDSTNSYSDGEHDNFYSPSEHEYDDLEVRTYDYTALSESERNKRIALIVLILRKIIPQLLRASRVCQSLSSTQERKRFLKLTLTINDIMNSFCRISNIEPCFKQCYDDEKKILEDRKAKNPERPGCYIRDEKLIWQCSDRMYDWIEAMNLLLMDVKKFKPCKNTDDSKVPSSFAIAKKKPSMQNERKMSVVLQEEEKVDFQDNLRHREGSEKAAGVGKDIFEVEMDGECSKDESASLSCDDQMNVDDEFRLEIDGLLSEIKAGVALITGIYSTPSSSDVVVDSVKEYLTSCDNGSQKIVQSDSDCASLSTSLRFLVVLFTNNEKASQFPCFSFIHRSDAELNTLKEKWEEAQKKAQLKSLNKGVLNKDVNCPSSDDIVNKNLEYIERLFDRDTSVSVFDNDILDVCNSIADALCLSSLSVMNHLVDKIACHLNDELEKLLKEPVKPVESENFDEDLATTSNAFEHVEMQSNKDQELTSESNHFEYLPNAPDSHRFFSKLPCCTTFSKAFYKAVAREIRLLQTCLPPGIFVKAYEDRIDLFSCMITGPQGTPYADGLFFFDVRLREDYPNRPPHVFFKSMSKTLNPNLYEDGMVCLSLLGTWDGKEMELWTSSSTLLQVFVSIQSLILVSEPYFNEPGYEKQKGTPESHVRSRDYNETAVLRTLESLRKILLSPPEPFKNEVFNHVKENWKRLSELLNVYQQSDATPESNCSFPLFPATQGFRLWIKKHSETLLSVINDILGTEISEVTKKSDGLDNCDM